MQDIQINISGMHCGGCASKVGQALRELPGVSEVLVSHIKGSATLSYDPAQVTPEQILAAVGSAGYMAQAAAA
jgi:copper chaperone CopZ